MQTSIARVTALHAPGVLTCRRGHREPGTQTSKAPSTHAKIAPARDRAPLVHATPHGRAAFAKRRSEHTRAQHTATCYRERILDGARTAEQAQPSTCCMQQTDAQQVLTAHSGDAVVAGAGEATSSDAYDAAPPAIVDVACVSQQTRALHVYRHAKANKSPGPDTPSPSSPPKRRRAKCKCSLREAPCSMMLQTPESR